MENSEAAYPIITIILTVAATFFIKNLQDVKFLKEDLRRLEEDVREMRWGKK